MNKNLTALVALALALVVSSCSHNKSSTEKKVDQEIQAVPATQTKSIAKTIKEDIMASSLTNEQKEKLMALEEKSHAERLALTDEIEKTKVVFIQTVLEPKMNQREYNILKKKLVDLDRKRMAAGFKTAEEVRKIIAPKTTIEERDVYRKLIENRMQGF